MRIMMAALCALGLAAGQATVRPHLRDVPEIDNGLFAVAVADVIRRNCPEISARMVKAYLFVRDLEVRAKGMGYSDDEIEAYVESKAEKARMKARGAAYFASHGVVAGDARSYCALGRAEIEKSSQIGALLKAN